MAYEYCLEVKLKGKPFTRRLDMPIPLFPGMHIVIGLIDVPSVTCVVDYVLVDIESTRGVASPPMALLKANPKGKAWTAESIEEISRDMVSSGWTRHEA